MADGDVCFKSSFAVDKLFFIILLIFDQTLNKEIRTLRRFSRTMRIENKSAYSSNNAMYSRSNIGVKISMIYSNSLAEP